MKIVHFISAIDKSGGGTTAYMKLLAEELNKFDIVQSLFTGFSKQPVEIEGVSIHFFEFRGITPFQLGRVQKISKKFSEFLDREEPDIVHINGIWLYQNYLFQREAQKLGIKVVLSPHGMLEPYIMNRNSLKKKIALALFQNKAIQNANYLHATAQSELDNIEKLGYRKQSIIIPNGIKVDNIELKSDFDSSNRKRNFLFLSRVHPKKGIDLLIEAVAQLEDKGNINITIAGNGEKDYVDELKVLSERYKVASIFNFVGPVYGEAKWDLFRNADVFILPTHSENFGIVVAESLLVGVPVITTYGTPWKELNTQNCGWWINLSVDNLTETLQEVNNTSDQNLKDMGLNGRKLIVENYSIAAVANSMMEFYNSICNENS